MNKYFEIYRIIYDYQDTDGSWNCNCIMDSLIDLSANPFEKGNHKVAEYQTRKALIECGITNFKINIINYQGCP